MLLMKIRRKHQSPLKALRQGKMAWQPDFTNKRSTATALKIMSHGKKHLVRIECLRWDILLGHWPSVGCNKHL